MKNLIRIGLGLLFATCGDAVAQQYVISSVAGGSLPLEPSATGAIGRPQGVATDSLGNVFFSVSNAVVLKLDTMGGLTRVAGNFQQGYSGDGGPATDAQLNAPGGLAVNSAGALFIEDRGNLRIRKVSSSGIISTFFNTTDAPTFGIAVDSSDSLYIAEAATVWKISPDGTITPFAGRAFPAQFFPVSPGLLGDGGPAFNAYLRPRGLAAGPDGAIYVADAGNRRIRKVSADGLISTFAVGDIGGLAIDVSGNVFASDPSRSRVWKFTSTGLVSMVYGDHDPPNDSLSQPTGVAVDAAGDLYISDNYNNRIRKVCRNGAISTVAGTGVPGYTGDDEAVNAQFDGVAGVAVDAAGSIYVSDEPVHRVRRFLPGGAITTIAGDRPLISEEDGASDAEIPLYQPRAVAVDAGGNVYISDIYGFRRVSSNGVVTTVARSHRYQAAGAAIGPGGDLYFSGSNRVFKLLSNDVVTPVAGNGENNSGQVCPSPRPPCYNVPITSEDGRQATATPLSSPNGVAMDRAGNLYIANLGRNNILKVSPAGMITTVAGNGVPGYSGDGGPATAAQLNYPIGVAVDAGGSLYIADLENYRIRKVTPDGVITTIAGNGTSGHSGDGGLGIDAQLSRPAGVAVDAAGNIYVADKDSVRMLQPSQSTVRAPAKSAVTRRPAEGWVGARTVDGGLSSQVQVYR